MRIRNTALLIGPVIVAGLLSAWLVSGQQPRRVDEVMIRAAAKSGEEWLSYNLSPQEQRYSPLKQIDTSNVARLKQAGRFIFLEQPAMCYRVHRKGFSTRGGIAIIRSRERFLLRMQELYAGRPEKQRLIDAMLADCYSDWGIEEMNSGKRRPARNFFLRSIKYNPIKVRTYVRCLRTFLPA